MFSQIEQLSNGHVNDINDSVAGGTVASNAQGTLYPGQVGKYVYFTNNNVRWKTNQCYGGWYQYVQTKAASTAAPARGVAACWYAAANTADNNFVSYIVTPDVEATNQGTPVAGVFLNAPTKGNFTLIGVRGVFAIQYASSVTSAAIGLPIFLTSTTAGTFDTLATGSTVTAAHLARWCGIVKDIPVNSAISNAWFAANTLNL